MVTVQDTKYPDKHPFEISEAGFNGLREKFGNRYVSLDKAIVTPDKIEIRKVVPAKTTTQGKK